MLEVSQEFKDALNVSHTKVSEFTVTIPGGEPVDLEVTSAQVSSSADSGTRYTARLDVVPQPGVDLYSILATPGARYNIRHGIDFGAGHRELIDMGVYEAASGSINIIDGSINVNLVDLWVWLERVRYSDPVTIGENDFATRAELLQTLVETAFLPSFIAPYGVVILDDGGAMGGGGDRVYDRSRTDIIKSVATDGQLDVYFNATGQFVIRKQPIIDPLNTVWTYRTGEASNITTAERERPFDRLYNTVVVNPIDEEQTWAQQAAQITDPNHPRFYEKVGVVCYFFSSPTLNADSDALAAAETILQRVQGTTETVSITGLGAPMLEVGDNITIAHEQTFSDPGFNATHIIDSFDYDLLTGSETLKTRSDSLADVEGE